MLECSKGGPADLVDRIQSGDRQAESELVERFERGISIILLRRVGDPIVVEELLQETFRLALLKVREREIRDAARLPGFLAGLARNLSREYFRRSSRHRQHLPIEKIENLASTDPSPDELLLKAEKIKIVRRVIGELNNQRDRQLIFRFYIAEEKKERICDDLEVSSLHFNRILYRARQRYRELYEKLLKK